jgi:pilus assembly protein CpaF
MRLGDRVRLAGGESGSEPAAPVRPVDPVARIRERAHEALFERLGARGESMDPAELRSVATTELTRILDLESVPLTQSERNALVEQISADILGYGPLQPLLADAEVSEIMVNGLDPIWVEREGRVSPTALRFASDDHLRRVIERIVAEVGRRIDEASPMVDARLPDGSRVNAVIPPLAVDGPALTIRKFRKAGLGPAQLVRSGSITPEALELLEAAVAGRRNVLVSGGTGSGKTTLLNMLSGFIPDHERIVSIEDAVELQLQQPNLVRLESRPRNVEGRGEITIRDLVRNALRMRPDRIIVGEVRGGEALDMLQAMNTGHEGSLSTLHANSTQDAMSRLETMVLMAGVELPLVVVREQVGSAVHFIVQVARLGDGSRRVVEIAEIGGVVDGTVEVRRVYVFDHRGFGSDGRIDGSLVPTEHAEVVRRALGLESPG